MPPYCLSCLPGGVAAGIHGIAGVWRAALDYISPDVAPDVAAPVLTHCVAAFLKCAPLLPSDCFRQSYMSLLLHDICKACITWHIFKVAICSRIGNAYLYYVAGDDHALRCPTKRLL